jgi:hypothetical protein
LALAGRVETLLTAVGIKLQIQHQVPDLVVVLLDLSARTLVGQAQTVGS